MVRSAGRISEVTKGTMSPNEQDKIMRKQNDGKLFDTNFL